MQGEAGEAGWGPEVVEGRGTAGPGTLAPWRPTIRGAPMTGSSSRSLRMTTGRRGSMQASPPGWTLWRQRKRGCHITVMQFLSDDTVLLFIPADG